MSTNLLPKTAEVDYPTGDGKPMAETDFHRILMNRLIDTLQWRYRDVPDVNVSGNLLMFYVEGDKRRHVSPDVYVAKGVSNEPRFNYLLWREGRPPNLVIEITSKSTRQEDQEEKLVLYQNELKVREYFLFDPLNQYLKPQLKGYRLQAGAYQPIEAVRGRLPSEEIGVHFEADGKQLRMFDPETDAYLVTGQEYEAQQAKEQRQRAEAAEQRVAELMAMLAKSQSQQPPTGQ